MREKKFGKLFLTWLLAATMVLTLLPVGMLAADAPDEAAEDGEAVLTPVAGAEAGETAVPAEAASMLLATPAAADTPIAVPTDKLFFDKANGVITGIDADWLAENKDKPLSVAIPAEITKIAITGPLSQVYILPLASDMLVGVCNEFSADAALYLPKEIFSKTEIGQLYGGKGEMDLEALLTAAPDIVIDIGEPKDSIVADLTVLTEQTGIPFIHIDATVQTSPEAYRTLGKLLGREEKAEELALWCERTYASITAMMERVDADNARKELL